MKESAGIVEEQISYGKAVCAECGCRVDAHPLKPNGLGCESRDNDGAPCGCELVFYAQDDAPLESFRAFASKWRDDALEQAAQIVQRYACQDKQLLYAADDIRAMKTTPHHGTDVAVYAAAINWLDMKEAESQNDGSDLLEWLDPEDAALLIAVREAKRQKGDRNG